MVSQPRTYLKAIVAGICTPLLPYLISILNAQMLALGFPPMSDTLQAALALGLGSLAVYWTPNSAPQPTVAELQAQIAAMRAAQEPKV